MYSLISHSIGWIVIIQREQKRTLEILRCTSNVNPMHCVFFCDLENIYATASPENLLKAAYEVKRDKIIKQYKNL